MTVAELILGRYRLDEEIAAGGTARVWRARDVQLDRTVAVKLLHPHLLPDETSRRRLAGEARAAAALSHSGIATVYDVTGPDDEPAIVMELVDGEPLSALIARDGPMRPDAAARLAADVADALYHAHQRGIVHRDVKPGNILVEAESGRARLIDFGIAHSLEAAAESLTHTGTAVGTPRYMAPEQLTGEPIGPRTDLWGLGAVLYEALSGGPPFEGGNPLAIARAQAAGAAAIPGIDPALDAIVRGCLAVPIVDRPVHAGRVAEALRAWLRGDSAPALGLAPAAALTAEMPTVESAAAPAAASAPEPAAVPAPAERRRRPPAIFLGVGAIVAVVLLAAAAFAWRGLPGSTAELATPEPSTGSPAGWRLALLADYRRACEDGNLERSDLGPLSYRQARELVDDRIRDCQSADEGNKPGNGNGKGGGHGHGHDKKD
jgi:tRNA A-37 threonylcarbamoyl transferase component Bud32